MIKSYSDSTGLVPNTFQLKVTSDFQDYTAVADLVIRQNCNSTSENYTEYNYIIEDSDVMSC